MYTDLLALKFTLCFLMALPPALDLTRSVMTNADDAAGHELLSEKLNEAEDFFVEDNKTWSCSPSKKDAHKLQGHFSARWHPAQSISLLPVGSLTVPVHLLIIGKDSVARQADGWSCGANSAARFAAMLGYPVQDYGAFKAREPTYGGFLCIPKIGADPERLQDYLRQHGGLQGFSISQAM